MSIFPAYSVLDNNDHESESLQMCDGSATSKNDAVVSQESWLQNASFDVEISQIPLPPAAPAETDESKVGYIDLQSSSKVAKKHKDKGKSKRKVMETCSSDSTGQIFWEDHRREKANLSVPTLFRPAVPLYEHRPCRALGLAAGNHVPRKVRQKDRYHVCVQRLKKNSSMPQEGLEVTNRTAEYNKTVADNPQDVATWLLYSRFQEEACQGGARVTAERQLAILDRALSFNPDSGALLRERVLVADQVLPAETLQQQLSVLLDKQITNLEAWQAYVECSQCSLATCSAPHVLSLYNEGLEKLHQSRRGVPAAQAQAIQEKIMDLLLRCCMFLRQSGLQEQLWTLLSMCLELNLSCKLPHPDPPEQQLVASEDAVLGSNLPLPALWVRLERLREGVHWLSCEADCADPQRLVFPDDVSDLVHPISGSDMRFVMATMLCLKVPLLPGRHTALQSSGLAGVSWWLDCPETLLATLEPLGPAGLGDQDFLKDIFRLISGPQYLCPATGQEEYLNFIVHTFHTCAESLEEPARTAVYVWWLRFERLLVMLDGQGGCVLPPQRKKKLKSAIKDFLKVEGNRNNVLYYREYALIEYELGHHDSALKILRTAICTRGGMPIVSIVCPRERAGLCLLYRTLCELTLRRGFNMDHDSNQQAAIHVLVGLALGGDASEQGVPPAPLVGRAKDKLHHISMELLADLELGGDGTEHLLPDLQVDWLCCYSWLLLLTEDVGVSATFLQDAAARQPASSWRAEALVESRVSLLLYDCRVAGRAYCHLWPELSQAVSQFPDNLHLLSTLATAEGSSGGGRVGSPWWKLARSLSQQDAIIPQVFHLLLASRKHARISTATWEARKLLQEAGPEVADRSADNRLAALFSRLQKHRTVRSCPLLWRLFLQFVRERGDRAACRTAFYQAIERCPWVKSLYVAAVELLPEELPQIQDLLMEKELRLHVLPEEVDILRKDSVTT